MFLPINKKFYSFNNTKFFDNNSQFNIGKKITNKLGINYTPEKVKQKENGFTQTFLGNQIFATTSSLSKPIINKINWNIKNELIWMLKKNEQIKLLTSFLNETSGAVNNSIVNTLPVNYSATNNKSFYNALLNYTKYLKKSKILNIAAFYEKEQNIENITNDGIFYNGTIFDSSFGNSKSVAQYIIAKQESIGVYAKFIHRKKDYSFTYQPTFKFINGTFNSTLGATSTTNINFPKIDTFSNSFTYQQQQISIPLKYSLDKDKWVFNIQIEPLLLPLSNIHKIDNPTIFNFNINMNTYYTFKNKSRLSVSYSKLNDFSIFNKSVENNVIIDTRNILYGTEKLFKNISHSISVYNFSSGSYTKKMNFSYFATANFNKPNYLVNNISNNFYNKQNFSNNTFSNKAVLFSVRNNITFSKLKLRLENDFTTSFREGISSQNDNKFINNSYNSQLETRLITKLNGWFNFQINNNISKLQNNRKGTITKNKSFTNISSIALNVNYKKKCHLDIDAKNYYFNTFSNSTNNIFLLNISYKQLLNKNKVRLSIDINNLTNKYAYKSQFIGLTQYSESQVTLLPFFILGKVEFMF